MQINNILFLTDNFPPEVNAPATRTFEHAKVWVSSGINVTVITTAPNFPNGQIFKGYKNKFFQKETIDGVNVIRVWSYISANKGFIKRTLDYLSFAFMAVLIGFFVKTDVIIATSPQFFTAISGRWLSFFKRKPWIMEVRDIWPESIVAVGMMKKNRVYYFLEKIEYKLYQSAYKIIVVTDSFKTLIYNRGIEKNKIFVHKNGVVLDGYKNAKKNINLIEDFPQFKGKKLIAYIGTHGLAHGLDFIINSLKRLETYLPNLHFLFIGDGAEKENLMNLANSKNLVNITFLNSVPKHEIVSYLSIIDVALVNLKKSDTFKSVIPSKIFEAAAMKKPILLGLDGESKQLINDFGAGLCFEPENEMDFIMQCEKIVDTEIYFSLQKGCEKLAYSFDREKIAKNILTTIMEN
jgi:glycosyltransferase involved in cell wall biosynthesis